MTTEILNRRRDSRRERTDINSGKAATPSQLTQSKLPAAQCSHQAPLYRSAMHSHCNGRNTLRDEGKIGTYRREIFSGKRLSVGGCFPAPLSAKPNSKLLSFCWYRPSSASSPPTKQAQDFLIWHRRQCMQQRHAVRKNVSSTASIHVRLRTREVIERCVKANAAVACR